MYEKPIKDAAEYQAYLRSIAKSKRTNMDIALAVSVLFLLGIYTEDGGFLEIMYGLFLFVAGVAYQVSRVLWISSNIAADDVEKVKEALEEAQRDLDER